MFLMQIQKSDGNKKQVYFSASQEHAEYDIKIGPGKVRGETPETAEARKLIYEYAAKLPEDKDARRYDGGTTGGKGAFSMYLEISYDMFGEKIVRNAIRRDPKVLDKIANLQEAVLAKNPNVNTPHDKVNVVAGFFINDRKK